MMTKLVAMMIAIVTWLNTTIAPLFAREMPKPQAKARKAKARKGKRARKAKAARKGKRANAAMVPVARVVIDQPDQSSLN